jgi:ABC-type nitrate/sulfonate/bicarbonate transport system ATPase subunit
LNRRGNEINLLILPNIKKVEIEGEFDKLTLTYCPSLIDGGKIEKKNMELKIENIEFAYNKEKNILKGISLSNENNQLMSIVGVSGCGKSTLLKIIAGLLPNSKGNYFSGKISIDNQNPEEFRKTGKLSFMFQEPTLMPNLTVKENIQLPLQILKKQYNGKVDSLLDMVGLSEYSNYLPKELSGGMKTRVALARSFISEPKLLLLDEPFTALDIAWREDLYKELKLLRTEFQTMVLMVTHDTHEAIQESDSIFALGKNGFELGLIKSKEKTSETEKILRNIILKDSEKFLV